MHFSTTLITLIASLSLSVQALPATSANPTLEVRSVLDKRNYGNCNGCDTRFYVGECYVDWYCNGAYPVKDGRDIKNVFTVGVWQKAGNGNCKACGEWWLTDGSNCHGTVQANGC
ncbi:hypothetical protein DDE82_002526 [Stemphylium lycopersici]|uniref:Uncharacterized protein n=1 Tax=Stemphylium lycopersici TaxID=183478 RepID=A0A364MS46_STELY|nr:hypothetical protein TW65_03527 [Stemphylium lycopersici]RAR00888.1 hypothetical protein DDE83_009038 [Stemphylium lycopersici]RAR07866.1 hypothetical protein DDE82_002526 [Stemphylium lycopersici]